ncbi:hypothetical protein ACJRO7_011904 [Eucalyptus globulus]|uniref:WAT1-related protein n=1 Tax=Eucalyptus globulus TaxID=34317 RepID=A0ABD3LK56_EUCGL
MEMEGRAGGSLPFVGMIMVVLVQASSMVVAKMAMSDGLNKYTLAFYCNALSSLVLLPCPFIISRRSGSCPPLTFSVLRKIFLLALVGSASQICGYAGIDYSSPVLGTAMMNLIPAFTFILAVISRMEKLNWKGSSSQAKLVGTVASILGALVITLYKGPTILRLPSLPSFVHPRHLVSLLSRQLNWVLGGFLLTAEAFFVIIVVHYAGIYPQRLPRGVEHNVLSNVLRNNFFRAIILHYGERAAVLDSETRCGFDRYFILGKRVILLLLKFKLLVDFEFEDKSRINIVNAVSGCGCL